jgi:O-antigen/teichoic acid export membrane protein
MAKSIKSNYIFTLISTISSMLFPVITFPYAARVLMADMIGQVNFFTSIVSYISLLTSLGIPMYAIRETARVRDDKNELNKTTLEIILLHTGLTAIGYLIVFILCATVAKIQVDIPLFLLISTTILFNALGVEWFYQGVEEFKYITIRGLIVRTICVVFLFIFVKTRQDLMYYAAYTVFGTVGNNILNFIHLRKHISIKRIRLKELHPMRHLVPSLRIFVLNLIVCIYVNLDSVMLGFIKDSAPVGYYTGATKLTRLALGIITSLGTVMLPRLSNLIQQGQKEEFKALAQKAVDFVVVISMPIMIGVMTMAPILIRLFCGESYAPAILTLQIISPIIFVIALSNMFGIQILYPQGKEKLVIISTGVGALINFTLNMLLIPKFSQNGAAIASVIGETAVTVTMFLVGRNHLYVTIFNSEHLKSVLAAVVMGAVCVLMIQLHLNDIISVILIPIAGAIVYALLLLWAKNPSIMMVKDFVKSKVSKH